MPIIAVLVDLAMIQSSSIFGSKLLMLRWIKCKPVDLKIFHSFKHLSLCCWLSPELLSFRRPQSWKLFSGRFINAVHLAHAPIIAEQNDLQRVLYPLSVLAAPSTDRLTFI